MTALRCKLLALTLCLLTAVLLARTPPTPAASDYVVREWHAEDGLPSEDVLQLLQDRSGYLWVACRGSLCRFDGATFFPEEAPEARDHFYSLLEETDGSILLAPREGDPVRYQDGHYTRMPLEEPHTRRAIGGLLVTPDQAHWYSLRGTVLRVQGNERQSFGAESGISESTWTRMATDAEGNVWLSGRALLARHAQGRLVNVRVDGNMSELRVVSSREGGPWLITPDRVLKFDADLKAVEIARLPPLLGAHYVNAALEDHDGLLWLGTRSAGLHVIGAEGPVQLPTASDFILALLEDREGTVWVGASAGGLSAVARKGYTLHNRSTGLAASGVSSVCADEEGAIWVANGDGGIARIRDAQIDRWMLRQGGQLFSAGLVSRHPEGGIWAVGGTGAAVFRMSEKLEAPVFLNVVPSWSIRTAMLTTSKGELWTTTSDRRVGRLQGETFQVYGLQEGVSAAGVRSFAETAAGELLAGTNEGTLLRFDGTRFVPAHGDLALDGAINGIQQVGGALWLATASNGIVVLQDGQRLRMGTAQGLPDNNITQLMPDDLGNVWCGSSRGVFRVTVGDVQRLLRGETGNIKPLLLGRDEGLGVINCQGNYGPGVARSGDGRIWFATRQGVLAVDPRTETRVLPQPRARIEQLRADDAAQPMTRRWVVEASTRKLELRFSSLCLSAPSRVDTYYRLVGFDSTWTHAKGGSSALYPQLQPGSYRFEIGASFGTPPEQGGTDQLEIVVVPLWWQTLWFRLLVATSLATLIGVAVRLWSNRRLRERVRNLERETAVARVRERIARDIHDEVGASLTRISLLSQGGEAPSTPEAENLRRIDETAREVTLALDEIVWAVNPQHDTLEGFVSYLSDFAQKLLSAAQIRCRLQIPASLPALDLPSELRHDLFLCCRETLNNVVRHAGASEVCIQVSITAPVLAITLSDNGRGLSSPSRAVQDDRVRRGHGLPNLRERMTRLGGSCLVGATEGGGTTVTLSVSLPGNTPRIP